jgi:uroporphyrinogen decarboxylase
VAKHEPSFHQFLQVMRREVEPDWVPLSEFGIDWGVMAEIQGPPKDGEDQSAWLVRFWKDMGFDYLSQGVNISFPHGTRIAEDTARLSHGTRAWVEEARGPITTWEEFERYPWPKVTDEAFAGFDAVRRYLPEGMKLVATIPGGPFENVTFLMGFESFSYALVEQPDLVQAVVDRIDEVLVKCVEVTAGLEWVGAQWINDDMGFKGGTLASPATLRRYIFPTQRKLAQIAHRRGKPVFLHSCGRLDAIMGELIDDIGVDAKHSFEHVIEPVWEAKRKWGKRVALLGGVDMDVLCRGAEDQVRAYTRRCIEECLPGGGWALGSGNTIANYVPPGNLLAMLDEAAKAR